MVSCVGVSISFFLNVKSVMPSFFFLEKDYYTTELLRNEKEEDLEF